MNKSLKGMISVLVVSFIFSMAELFGGALTNSVSMISDSIRNFSNVISIGIAVMLEKYSLRRANQKFTFGYSRFSVIGSLVSTIFMLITSSLIFFITIPRIFKPQIIDYDVMFIIAAIGLVINGLNRFANNKSEKINESAINLHQFESVLSWVSLFVVSIMIKLFNLEILDPILSLIINIIILIKAFEHIRKILDIFLEKVPSDIDIKEIKSKILENNNIQDIKYFHVWTIDGIKDYASLFIVIDKDCSLNKANKLKEEVKEIIKDFGITYSTVEIEIN